MFNMGFINGQTFMQSLLAVTVLQWLAVRAIAEDTKGSNSEWQSTKLTILERSRFMFNNSLMSDVKFIPRARDDDEPIYAHKYILATSSPVFYELFYGESPIKRINLDLYTNIYSDEGYVVIEADLTVEPVVLAFLRFLYKEECPENVEYIVQDARKMATNYRVPSFETACKSGIEVKDPKDYNDEWQLTKSTLLSRTSFMYNNPLMSDIKFFSTDGYRIFAHKYILATSSSVFYEMFYGQSKRNTDSISEDFNEEIVAAFLHFLYKDECPKNIETVLKVLGMTKKYRVQSFETACKNSLEFDSPWPAFKVIEKFLEVEAEEMAEPWWSRIESRLDEVIASEYFLKINQRTLIAFLERDTLCYPEKDLFQAIIKWSEYQCSLQRISATVKNVRKVLGDSIFRIRFLSMTEEDFKRHVVSWGVLTDNEVIAVIEAMRSGAGKYNYKWALPERNKRAWYCKYFTVEQLKTNLINYIILLGMLVLFMLFMKEQQRQLQERPQQTEQEELTKQEETKEQQEHKQQQQHQQERQQEPQEEQKQQQQQQQKESQLLEKQQQQQKHPPPPPSQQRKQQQERQQEPQEEQKQQQQQKEPQLLEKQPQQHEHYHQQQEKQQQQQQPRQQQRQRRRQRQPNFNKNNPDHYF